MTASSIKNYKEKFRELIDSTSSVGIIIGENQNIDTVGAALGLYLALTAEGKNVQIIAGDEPTVEVSNLFAINKVGRSFEGQTKVLTISVPYREGEIEKVSYNIEGDRLNVNLFAEGTGISFRETDIDYVKKGSSPSLIITISVSSESELSRFVDPKTVKTIHIDKNPLNTLSGDVNLIEPAFSSVSEIVSALISEMGYMSDSDGLQNLMDGITFATKNFTSPQTSAFAFEAAGFLLQNGAKRKERVFDRNISRDEKNRSFPREELFLNQNNQQKQRYPSERGQSNANQNQKSTQFQKNTKTQNFPNIQNAQKTQSFEVGKPANDIEEEESFNDNLNSVNRMNITKASGEAETSMNDEIPEDWFLPKVFKGSKRGN